MGFAWSVPVSSKEKQQGENKRGGGKRIIGEGVQNRFWEGVLWYVFPSPEFSTPLCFSLIKLTGIKMPSEISKLNKKIAILKTISFDTPFGLC